MHETSAMGCTEDTRRLQAPVLSLVEAPSGLEWLDPESHQVSISCMGQGCTRANAVSWEEKRLGMAG